MSSGAARDKALDIVASGHAGVQFREPACSITHVLLHACLERFNGVFCRIGFVRQLIVDDSARPGSTRRDPG